MEFEVWWETYKPVSDIWVELAPEGEAFPLKVFAEKIWDTAREDYRDGLDWNERD